ncbi:GNAT family N-acetyltransferase [Bacteroidota bacterium]
MIRKIKPKDKKPLYDIINTLYVFTEEEKKVAEELIDCAIHQPEQGYYISIFEENNEILGYYCIGLRPLTDGVYDLYWIVVKSTRQNQGIGKKLLIHAEQYIEKKLGRWLLIETSSKESYNNTRNFYLRNLYTKVAEINNFYKKDENLIIYGKYFIT